MENWLKFEIKIGVDNNWTDNVMLIISIMLCLVFILEKNLVKNSETSGLIYTIAKTAKNDKTKPKSAHKNKGLINNIKNPVKNIILLIS